MSSFWDRLFGRSITTEGPPGPPGDRGPAGPPGPIGPAGAMPNLGPIEQRVTNLEGELRTAVAALRATIANMDGVAVPDPIEPDPIVIDPPPATGFESDGEHYGLRINPDFDPARPTLKDGTLMTGDMLTQYRAATKWALEADATSGDWARMNLLNRMGHPDLYNVAREGQVALAPLFGMQRLSGDGRLLDRAAVGFARLRANFVTKWESIDGSGWDDKYPVDFGDPWSPHEKTLYRGGGGDATENGTDLSNLNIVKLYAMMAEFAWALHVNRDAPSPAGLDYNALADEWGRRIETFYETWAGDAGSDWTQNYRGVDGIEDESLRFPSGGRYRERAPWGVWPVMLRNEAHAGMDSVGLTYYLGKLGMTGLWDIPNPEAAITMADAMVKQMRERSMVECMTPTGPGLLSRRSRWFTGEMEGAGAVAFRSTYASYTSGSFISWHLIGRWRNLYDADTMAKITRTFASSTLPSGEMYNNLGYATTGHPLDLEKAAPGSVPNQSVWRQATKAPAKMLVFAPADEPFLAEVATRVQAGLAGGWDNPKSGTLAYGLFVRSALDGAK